ncbi:unnamed protein product [Microthlaspi erraticum]|uniref:Late embryogenesis abundant protein LEA-2 subgroup domain-containing protein n=1 Tax=Microthlaspi erraticum TaxID=1685480 RepID=A0A6D2JPW4_9BRAS|nr:unnamed protein product [Microthlaspi erraticum]CAA7061120.1 unnamed protein product [Microthlaspi erraticum]
MDSQTNTYQPPRSSSSSGSRLNGWWFRPIVTPPANNDDPNRKATFMDFAAGFSPFLGALFTVIAMYLILSLKIDKAHPHAKVSIQHIDVSSNTWQVDFLVKDPSSRYSIYYDDSDASVRLGQLNAAVLNITRKRGHSRDHTLFSLAFVAEQQGNRSGVVSEELDVKLRAKHKLYLDPDEAGHFNIRCQNLTRSRDKIILCQSIFTKSNRFLITYLNRICQITY